MNLDPAHLDQVREWIKAGLNVADVQRKLADELGVRLTYMQVRFLLDDLKLAPKDADPPKPTPTLPVDPAPEHPASPAKHAGKSAAGPPPLGATKPRPAGVSVSVDELAKPGAVVSGRVTFSDGQTAEWYLDQMGRLGLVSQQPGYKPSNQDVMAFQTELQNELGRLGF